MTTIGAAFINGGLLVLSLVLLYPLLSWLERRSALAAEERQRDGWRTFLPLSRSLKLLSKRSAPLPGADRPLHLLAPFLGIVFSVTLVALIPLMGVPPFAVAPGGSLPAVFALLLATTWTVALAGAAGNNRLALLGGLRLSALRTGTLIAAGLGLLAVAHQLGSTSLSEIVRLQQLPAFAFLPGSGVMAWGIFVSPLGTGTTLVALAVLSQRMSPTRPDLALDLIDGYAAATAGPILLSHRVFEILELLAHGAIFATVALGSFSVPFVALEDIFDERSLAAAHTAVVVVKTLFSCVLILIVRRVLPPLSTAQATKLSWVVLVPLAALSVVLPRDILLF